MRGEPILRFVCKVLPDETGCWNWVGLKSHNGYGVFSVNSAPVRAHRWAYEYLKGPIPAGLQLDHLCRNRACVNPDHLDPVSRHENLLRGTGFPGANSRKTHCPAGHEYAGANLRHSKSGARRICRACARNQCAARRARNAGVAA